MRVIFLGFLRAQANCNTISRKFYRTLLDQGLKCTFYRGPSKDIETNLVGGQRLHVLSNKINIMTEVIKTTL